MRFSTMLSFMAMLLFTNELYAVPFQDDLTVKPGMSGSSISTAGNSSINIQTASPSAAESKYLAFIKQISMPDITIHDHDKFISGVESSKINVSGYSFWEGSPLNKFSKKNSGNDLWALQKKLLQEEKNLESAVQNSRTDHLNTQFWKPTIDEATKRVSDAQNKLKNTWNEFKPLLNEVMEDYKSTLTKSNKNIDDLKKENIQHNATLRSLKENKSYDRDEAKKLSDKMYANILLIGFEYSVIWSANKTTEELREIFSSIWK
ncbi:MAG: hypothetical protein HQM10_23595 [Candidatus Riflebacteria bacterium]|nr:hypothetical protein [Candidatus Riflebacteria bacterium]